MDRIVKKAVLILTGLAACAAVPFALTNVSSTENVSVVANDANYNLVLNSANAPTNYDEYSDFSQTFDAHKDTTLDYKKAKTSAGNHVALESGGSIEKREASKSLVSVNIIFTGAIRFESSYDGNYESGSYMSFSVTSNSTTNVWGNYWRVIAEADSVINSIDLVYGCQTASSATTGSVSISSFDSVNNYFVTGETIEDEFYLVFYANVDKSFASSLLSPDELILQDKFHCSFIQYRSEMRIKAYFNLSKYVTNVSYAALQHLTVRGDNCTVYNADGDLRHASKRVNAQTFETDTYMIDIYEKNWGSGTGYMAGIRFTPKFGIASTPSSAIVNQTSVTFVNNDTVRVRMITAANSVKNLDESSFALSSAEDGTTNKVEATSVTVGEDYDVYGYLLDIDFPINFIYSKWNKSSDYDYWCHLFVGGKTYDGSTKGDLKTSESISYSSGTKSVVKTSPIYIDGDDTGADMKVVKAYNMIIIRICGRG